MTPAISSVRPHVPTSCDGGHRTICSRLRAPPSSPMYIRTTPPCADRPAPRLVREPTTSPLALSETEISTPSLTVTVSLGCCLTVTDSSCICHGLCRCLLLAFFPCGHCDSDPHMGLCRPCGSTRLGSLALNTSTTSLRARSVTTYQAARCIRNVLTERHLLG